jgi:glutaminyl-peptide cyclotransferase
MNLSPRKRPASYGLARFLLAWFVIVSVLLPALSCSSPPGATATFAPASTPESTTTLAPTRLPATPTPPPPTTAPEPSAIQETPVYGYRIVQTYPHDPEAFTQGLVYEDGILYEGTGLTLGRSSLRKVDLETGDVLQIHNLESEYFGEGISVVGDRIWQLTWQNHVAFLYDKETFEQLDTVQYPMEGWGLTYDGARLIMSDGTATLYFRDPETFEEIGHVQVHDDQGPIARLNELEYIDGLVYANVWQTDRIALIDPGSGRVTAWANLEGLLQPEDYAQTVDVLNGIAHDAAHDRLFVTGKLWPKLFEIELIRSSATFLPMVTRTLARDTASFRSACLQLPVE